MISINDNFIVLSIWSVMTRNRENVIVGFPENVHWLLWLMALSFRQNGGSDDIRQVEMYSDVNPNADDATG